MHKVFINAGHGGSDSGAVKFLVEKDINLKMAKACRDYLVARDVEVLMGREADETVTSRQIIIKCNNYNPDCAVDVHNNAGGGKGFEVYHSINPNSKGIPLAKAIEQEVIKIGQNSRGLKSRRGDNGDYYYFIREIACPSTICEGVFVDNAADAAMADTDEKCKAFGEAYAKGILAYLGVKESCTGATDEQEHQEVTSSVQEAAEPYLVKVTADALRIRKEPSLSSDVVGMIRDNGVYTIMEQRAADGYTWGRLKSGAGWIALEHTRKL